MLRAAASLVAPPQCAVCAAPCHPADPLCAACERKVSRLTPLRSSLRGGIEVVSAVAYEGIAKEIIRRLKFSSRLALAEIAAERMVRAWGATREGWLVPVPPAPARERARGFDDAAILARLVARECPYARVLRCLERDDGPRQVRRSREERTSDPPRVCLSATFSPRVCDRSLPEGTKSRASAIPPGDLWLVDDVATTGATLSACAHALRSHGATQVRALTFAHADK